MRRLLVTFVLLLAGCGRVERQDLLPWFRIKTSHPYETGILSLGHSGTEFFVKIGPLWKKLDTYGGGAIALNPNTVVFYANGQAQIIRRGETTFRPACGPEMAFATFARKAEAVDCVQTLEGPLGAPTKIRWRRMAIDGRIIDDRTLQAETPEREFASRYYDDNDALYFVTIHKWPYTNPECAIMDAAGHSVVAAVEHASECSNASTWSAVLHRRLH